MFPWLAHGHISPFFELAKKLTKRNFFVYFCSTPVNLTSLKEKLKETNHSHSIQLLEVHLQSPPDLPPHHHTTNRLPHRLHQTLVQAVENSVPNFSNILKTLSPNLLIYDPMMSWAPSLASTLNNIPAVAFTILGATHTSYLFHRQIHGGAKYPFDKIFLRKTDLQRMLKDVGSSGERLGNQIGALIQAHEGSCEVMLIKSNRVVDGKYVDYLSSLSKNEIVPVGFLLPDYTSVVQDMDRDIIEWLNKKEDSSTVYVSFGSESFLSEKEFEELAFGLELSNVNFIWVIRFPAGQEMKVEEALPKGFLDRVKERGNGLIVDGWAPQTHILRHRSTGGFFSHCGWGSVNETMSLGVPLIMMPMQADQPFNARLAEEVGVGLEVMRDENGDIHREDVARVIKEVLVEKSGEEIRKKAKELGERIRNSEDEINSVVEELEKVIHRYNKPG